MAEIIINEVAKYLDNLTATSQINVSLGTTLNLGKNLFVVYEQPNVATELTIIPYGGLPPNVDKYRQDSSFQLRLKAKNIHSSLKSMQELINTLHENTRVCASTPGKIEAIQSSPVILGWEEAEYLITVGNFKVKYIKL